MKQEKIVLVVTDGRDYSIKEVSEWLCYYAKQLSFKLIVFDVSKQKLEIKRGSIDASSNLIFGITDTSIEFDLSSIVGIFIRQACVKIIDHTGVTSNSGVPADISSRFSNYLMAYEANIRWLVLNCLSKTNIIGYDSGSFINKLEVLKTAAEVGLKIPSTILTNCKNDILDFRKMHKELIVKSVGLNLSFFDLDKKLQFHQLTSVINEQNIRTIPETFNLTLIQNRINKIFEIRVFYLDENCHSWALLSQSNEKTTVDYRNYDWENPMRVVPFTLPDTIEEKIIALMNELKLRTGSIDLIYSDNREYIFLEVNPAGQYGYNSDCGNNDIDKLLAESILFRNERKKHRTFHS